MAKSKFAPLRTAVAANPNTQTYVMEEFAVDRSTKVRVAVAGNKNLNHKAWATLSADKSEEVTAALLAAHPTQPAKGNHRA